jgi:hypothetical protein
MNGTQWNDQGHSSQFGSHTFSRLEITSQCRQMFLCNIQFKIIILIHFILIMRTIYCRMYLNDSQRTPVRGGTCTIFHSERKKES